MTAITTRLVTVAECGRPARPAPLEVRAVEGRLDAGAWATYAATAPDATVFHHPHWSRAVADVFGHTPLHLIAERGGRLVGVLPLMEVDSRLAGRLHISVPYGTYGGILAHDDNVAGALAAEAVKVAQEREARVLELRSDAAGVASFEALEGYVGFTRKLPASSEDVAGFLPKRARAAARHARDRDGVIIHHDRGLIGVVYDLYCRSMRRIGSLNYPLRFFERLLDLFGDDVWVSAATLGGRPIAGTISFVYRDTIMPYVLGADERVRCDGAANLLYWSLMECAVGAGLRRFDYGRSRAENTGAMGFKKNQGFEPRPLGYQRYVPPGRSAPDLRASSQRFELARRLWPRLPLLVTRSAGAVLARWIPG
jgi:FemAB-related protein (PEP-CTERM system-associated)